MIFRRNFFWTAQQIVNKNNIGKSEQQKQWYSETMVARFKLPIENTNQYFVTGMELAPI